MKVTSSTLVSSLGNALKISDFFGIVEMRLDLAARLGAQFAHQRMQHGKHVEEIARLRHLVDDRLEEAFAAILDGRERIGDDEHPERSSADDEELEGLHEHFEMPAQR